jgi:hypothetical protein
MDLEAHFVYFIAITGVKLKTNYLNCQNLKYLNLANLVSIKTCAISIKKIVGRLIMVPILSSLQL